MDRTNGRLERGAPRLFIGLFVPLAACTVNQEGGRFGQGGPSLGTGDDGAGKGGDSQAETDGEGESGEVDDDTGGSVPSFDLGSMPAGDGLPPGMGCTKADFLFVVDNSRSMQNKQEALAATFKPFMQQIEENLQTDDVHVMVVDTDAENLCTPEACADPGDSGPALEHCLEGAHTDGGYACTASFDACDSVLGAGVVHPAGNWASNEVCPVTGNKRYLDDTDDLVGSFDCMARVGTAGVKRERPIDAMLAALDPTNACNQGFLRDDAILVVTFISDDQCWEDHGTPQDWKDALAQVKAPEDTVVVGFIPDTADCMHDPDACDSAADVINGAHWLEFVEMFEDGHGLHGVVCDTESFADLFGTAVTVIDSTCRQFEPPG